MIIATTGSLANTVGANQPFRYKGYVYDEETGFYYLQSRYYDPTTCRFISADVLLSTGQGVIGHNSFAYCLNMPTNGADSNGHVFRPYSVQMTDSGSGNAGYYASEIVRKRASKKRIHKKIKLFKTIKAVNKKLFGDITYQHGIGGLLAFGGQWNANCGYAFDSSGNVGLYVSVGGGCGTPSLGAYDIQTVTTGGSLNSLTGWSYPIGGSANVYKCLTAGGEFSCGQNPYTKKAMFSFSGCGGVSAKLPVNAEVHGGTQYTKVMWSFNVLDWLSNLFGE